MDGWRGPEAGTADAKEEYPSKKALCTDKSEREQRVSVTCGVPSISFISFHFIIVTHEVLPTINYYVYLLFVFSRGLFFPSRHRHG